MTDHSVNSMQKRHIKLLRGKKVKRISFFIIFNIIFGFMFFNLLRDLLISSFHNEYYSYIPVVPLVSAYFFYQNRESVFIPRQTHSLLPGVAMMTCGVLLIIGVRTWGEELDHYDVLSLATFGLVWIWIGMLTLCCGIDSLKRTAFPLFFLFFAVPLPNVFVEGLISLFQQGSTEAADTIFKVTGIPVVREGFYFHLQGLSVQVAKECSGIRSGLSLILTGVIAARLFLENKWTRTILIASIIPIAMIKNGMRIATLTVLGAYWDQRILDSDLHKKGGILFFILALVILGCVIVLLKKYENKKIIAG